MSRFAEFGKYKTNILLKLIEDQEIVKCLYFSNSEDTNFLDKTLPDNFNPTTLIYERIFPYQFVPDIQDTTKTFITLSFNRFRLVNNSFKSGYIHFYVFTHKSCMKTDYATLRTDFLVNKIDSIMNQSVDFGIGKLQFNNMDDIIINNNYIGNVIEYKNYEFN